VANLTIEPGVQIFGNSGADYLVVNRGSKMFANGTATNPVIFTSFADLNNSQSDPANAIGEWGGLVILGKAPINRCAASGAVRGSAQCEQVVEGVTNPEAVYGGALANDSSGSLRYVQVKHAGFAINTAGNELNGITLAGAGNGTVVEYVQVHNNADDGIELFGGTVNLKYVVLTGNDDDMFDTDNGWNGATQFLIAIQRPGGGDNIVEASSVGSGIAPLSDGRVSNFTFVANASNLGNPFRLNTGTIGRYVNGVVSSGRICMRWESSAGAGSAAWAAGADPTFNSVLFSCTGGLATSNSIAAKPAAAVAADANNTTGTAATLTSGFINGAAEAARPAFNVTTLGSYFTPVTYVGAVRDANDTWWRGWSCGLESATPC
jgi:trimeric autotransporter adhesin